MLVCRKVRNDVEALLLAEDAGKDRVSKVQRIGSVFFGDLDAGCASEVPREFGQSVLVEVNYNQAARKKPHNGLDEATAYAAGSAYDADGFVLNLCCELFRISVDIGFEHADGTLGDGVGNEFVEDEYKLEDEHKLSVSDYLRI